MITPPASALLDNRWNTALDLAAQVPVSAAKMVAALKQRAAENGESLSDLLRRGALMVLGICPTCGQKAPQPATTTGEEPK